MAAFLLDVAANLVAVVIVILAIKVHDYYVYKKHDF